MKNFINITSATLIVSLVLGLGYMSIEPELVSAATASDATIITLNVTAGISITNAPNTSMSTALGVSSNTAIATSTWNVKTNNHLGYTLMVKAGTAPAMQASSTALIPDYQTGAPNTWSVTAGNAAFGYSAYGTDVLASYKSTGTSCGATSTPNVSLNYKGFTTSDVQIATSNSTTTPSGVDSTVCYAVEQDGMYINSGTYTATITATATTI